MSFKTFYRKSNYDIILFRHWIWFFLNILQKLQLVCLFEIQLADLNLC